MRREPVYTLRPCGNCKGAGRVWGDGKFIPCVPEKYQRLTHHGIPGRNRRAKRRFLRTERLRSLRAKRRLARG